MTAPRAKQRRPDPPADPAAPDFNAPEVIGCEMGLLAAMLMDASAREAASQRHTPADFYRDQNAALFAFLQGQARSRREIDLFTVLADLEADGRLEQCGGREYVVNLFDHLSNVDMAPEYSARVQNAAQKRRLWEAARELSALSAAPSVPAAEAQRLAESLIGGIGAARPSETCEDASSIIYALNEKMEAREADPDAMLGVPCGLSAIDALLNGLQSPDLILVGARPGMGKSSLLTTIGAHVAREGIPTLLFSMEMSREQVMLRTLCSMARVDQHALRSARLTPEELTRYHAAAGALYRAPLGVDDRSGATPGHLRAAIRRFRERHGGIGLIGIDYVQLMRCERDTPNRNQDLTEVSIEVKAIAREFRVPVLALAQVGRVVETRQDKRPLLSDLKDCGQFEQDADIVAFLYNDAYYREGAADPSAQQEVEFIVRKHRNGPTDTVKLGFVQRYTLFRDWAGDF